LRNSMKFSLSLSLSLFPDSCQQPSFQQRDPTCGWMLKIAVSASKAAALIENSDGMKLSPVTEAEAPVGVSELLMKFFPLSLVSLFFSLRASERRSCFSFRFLLSLSLSLSLSLERALSIKQQQ